ncbi:phospholipase D family protein [Ideonella sp. A 288]|uniref:phospholipase D family protein n=1 Tax=Ideonella sp. A 288 TaxID=1962181 RepID=UPI000B4B3CC0|nr:phospholipase D family protein [Ideonella sp. A 288]
MSFGPFSLSWLLPALLLPLLPLLLGGCAGLPPSLASPPSLAIAASTGTPLGAVAARAAERVRGQGPTGVLSMAHPGLALDARLSLIRQARASIDLQVYHLADDSVGHEVLRALRDAALRGVRVRLLIDDFHTAGMDGLLLGLAVHDGAQVRLFNPFAWARGSSLARWMQMAGDFRRLNHRMHNKLFIADGTMAIVGGRNLADGYFQRDAGANFIDFDALAIGAVVPELAAVFDRYWNSAQVRDIATLAAPDEPAPTLRARFEAATQKRAPPFVAPATWRGRTTPRFDALLADDLPGLIGAEATVFADAPAKLDRPAVTLAATTTGFAMQGFRESRQELMLFSPYFVPGESGLAGLREARKFNIAVRVITNSLGATDEPQASLAYERYRVPLLQMGVELYEVSAMQAQRDESTRRVFGASRAQLHAKLALIDRRAVLLGSMNLDQRSATTNTEMVLLIRSRELTGEILAWFNSKERADVRGSYQVRLKPDGRSLQWVALLGEGRTETLDEDPEFDHWERLRLWLISLFVPESLL